MKNSYKHDYPNAWEKWFLFSKTETIEFSKFDEWCSLLGVSIGIIEYPEHYSIQFYWANISKEFGNYSTWFDALDAVVKHIFELVEGWCKNEEEILDLYIASKELDTNETSKEGILEYYNGLILEMAEQCKDMLKNITEKKQPNQKEIETLDSIIIIALTCKRLLTE